MSATISDGITSITPTLVTELTEEAPSGNRRHELLGGGIAMSIRGAGLRSGALSLFFPLEADAAAAVALHRAASVFTLTYPERPTLAMSYVLADGGTISRELDDETRDNWIVHVDYQEVQA